METSVVPTPEASSPAAEVASSTAAGSSGATSSGVTVFPVSAGSMLCMLAAEAFVGMVLL